MVAPRYEVVVAYDEARGIGKAGRLPWHLHEDMEWFSYLTKGSVCIVGRKTYEEILLETQGLGLRNRYCLVLGSKKIEQKKYGQGEFKVVPDIVTACTEAEFLCRSGWGRLTPSIYIIGGQTVYEQTMFLADVVWATEVKGKFDCDSFFPALQNEWSAQTVREFPQFTMKRYERANS